MTLGAYLNQYGKHMPEGSLAALEQMDDATFAAVVALNEELNGYSDPGISSEVAITNGDVSDFESARKTSWSERGSREEAAGGVIYRRVQTRKGSQRVDLAVMQWGERVIALTR